MPTKQSYAFHRNSYNITEILYYPGRKYKIPTEQSHVFHRNNYYRSTRYYTTLDGNTMPKKTELYISPQLRSTLLLYYSGRKNNAYKTKLYVFHRKYYCCCRITFNTLAGNTMPEKQKCVYTNIYFAATTTEVVYYSGREHNDA